MLGGNVGIGVNTPGSKLQVLDVADVEVRITSGDSNVAKLSFGDASDNEIGGLYYDNTDDHLELRVNNNETARLVSTGEMLVGYTTVSAVSEEFGVDGIGGFGDPTLTNPYVIIGNIDDSDGFIGTHTNHNLQIRTNNTNKVTVTASGDVGIGEVAPDSKLEVNGTGHFTGTLLVDQTTTINGSVVLTGSSPSGTQITTPVSNTIAFDTGGSERFRISSGGAIGLGGANYGTAGQVLSSNGPSAQPTWTSIASGVPDISTLDPLP